MKKKKAEIAMTSFYFRMSKEDKQIMQNHAASVGVGLSHYLRVRGLKKPIVSANASAGCDPALLRELNKIGNNLNQIAKHLNQTQNYDSDTLNTSLHHLNATLSHLMRDKNK